MQAMRDEMDGLLEKGTFKKIPKECLQADSKILKSRFVLAIRDIGTAKERLKARVVVLGHLTKMKNSVLNDALTLMRYKTRILPYIASIFYLILYSRDVKQAYVQSETDLQRDLYVLPPKAYNMASDYAINIIKLLYEITESGS